MKEEQIEKAALEYAMAEMGLDYIGELDFEKGFVKGVQWRINSVWHDGNVSCQPRRKALVTFKNGNAAVYNDLRDLSYERLWEEVLRFAYLDDLLPERKEVAE